jgi:hypothetical protein
MKHRGELLLTVSLILTTSSIAQDLSSNVYPSEDELYQAFALGEIDFEQYLAMLEIIYYGIDSTNRFWYDDIQNLTYFRRIRDTIDRPLEYLQQEPFTEKPRARDIRGEVRYRLSSDLESEDERGYRLSGTYEFGGGMRAFTKVHREFSGRERIVGRAIEYHSQHGVLRELSLGNFATKYGLGTVVGYRGKLLQYCDQLGRESAAFPDYGGFNGLQVDARFGAMRFDGVTSHTRDLQHRLVTSGGIVEGHFGNMTPGLIVAFSRLVNRSSGAAFDDIKVAATSRLDYTGGYTALELTRQSGDRSSLAALLEGRHRFRLAEIRYAGWSYDDDFVDLSSGSKAANVHRSVSLSTVDFSYSTKRTGQNGGLIRTVVQVAPDLNLASSLLYGGISYDESLTEISTALLRDLSVGWTVQIDYQYTTRRRLTSAKPEIVSQTARAEARFQSGDTRLRSYIACVKRTDRTDYASVFLHLRMNTKPIGLLDLWSNLGRLSPRAIEYWYAFVRFEQQLSEQLMLATKLTHAFNRNLSDRHQSTISLELTALL